ncbi:uncharacterized protein LOC105281639 isoform X4 [Ooceraea biroi]|uniref:uncharacterized protein LOC105281639 isoform X4 n=1 Tax=Ooceraea biroi TaxID=2015173 RepID=UPI0005BC1E6E|nr:uncharacterized protein LOC105281639 isoform X4 [Ooceraea biroi]
MSKQQSCNYHRHYSYSRVRSHQLTELTRNFSFTFEMSDIADALLAQYYGFSKNSKPEKFLSIHECVSHAENDVHKLVGEQSTADTNDDDTSKETELQANNVENEESNSEDIPVRSSQALEREALDDDEETGFDIIFEGDTGNVFENINASSSKKAKDLTLNTSKAISTILAPEDNEGNDLYLSLSEDALADSASDISSVAGRKTSPKSSTRFASPSTPPQEKVPVYNETFIDLAGTGLTSLPIEMVKNYFIIRMLYLENNSLTELPKELFASLPKLQWLDVRNNQLTSLPASIKSHPSLETILLEGNKIEKLPLELCLVPKLKILNVAHNPIVEPPEDVIALGCSSILNYLRTKWNKLHPNGSVKFVEQRIEPRLSTILCYQSPREKRLKLPKISRRTLKSANNIGDSSTGMSTRKKSRAYKPSNRYINIKIDTFSENSANNTDDTHNNTSFLCASCACARNDAAARCKDESHKGRTDAQRNDGQHTFLNMITSCHDIRKTCIRNEIAEMRG